MTAPLDTLRTVAGTWFEQRNGGTAKDLGLPDWPAFLDRVFPQRWPDVPISPLSSGGSPIQLSVDTARPDELRLVIELSSFLSNDPDAIVTCIGHAAPDQARMLSGVMRLAGGVPRLGIGLRINRNQVSWKVYAGSDSPGDFWRWIHSFRTSGLLPRDRAQPAIALCERIAASAVMRGCSFVGVKDELRVNNVYYRSLAPYRQADVAALLKTANLSTAAPALVAMAAALGFSEGTGRGCFGYMVGLRPDGGVDNLKVEFWSIPWLEGHQLSLTPLERLGISGLEPAALLGRVIAEAGPCERPAAPEVVSFRSSALLPSSVVTYFALPRDGNI